MNVHSFIQGKAMADKKTRKKKKTKERREQILKAGEKIFTEKGYAAATIPEIAQSAGVAAGTIYLYFPSKRELFIEVIKSTIFTVPLLSLISKIPTGDFAVIFKNILKDRFELIQSESMMRMPALITEVWRDTELKEMWLKDFLHPFLKRMEMAYRMLTLSGKARPMEPAVAVRIIGGMIFGFMMLKMVEGKDGPLNKMTQEELAGEIVEFVLHGLMNNTGKTKKDGKK
jgi:AcrR family transcriptional regulator